MDKTHDSTNRSDLNDKIIEVVAKKGLTHADVARLAHTSRTRVTAILNRNTHDISTDRMLRVLGTTLFRNLGLERERLIVGLGSFHSIKGIDLAVKAVALLPEPRPPLAWIANSGSETYRSTICELARSLGVELRIKLAVSDSELVATLNQAALLLYTSRLEPFGFAPLEANACGLPVVGIAEGGIRETVQDGVNGFLVDPEAESIARAANQLLQDPTLARQMGERGAINVQQTWNVERSVDRLERILLQVCRKKESGRITGV